MRFLAVMVLVWLGSSADVFALTEVSAVSPVWESAAAQVRWYGAAPLMVAMLCIAGLWVARRLRQGGQGKDAISAHHRWLHRALALGFLLAGLGITFYRVEIVMQQNQEAARLRFQQQMDRIESDIQARFELLLQFLQGIRSTVVSRKALTRDEFRDWVASFDLETQYPGTRGVALVDRVERASLGAYVAAQRKDGQADFAVRTSGDASDVFIVKYIEPMATNQAAVAFQR